MKSALFILALTLVACGDDETSNNTQSPANNTQTNTPTRWTSTGELEAEGTTANINDNGSALIMNLGWPDGLMTVSLEGATFGTTGEFSTQTNLTVSMSNRDQSCGATSAAPPAETFLVTLQNAQTGTAKGTFSGTLPCSRGPATSITFSGEFDF